MSLRDIIPWNSRRSKVPAQISDPFTNLQQEINRIFDSFYEGFDLEPFRGFESSLTRFSPRVDVKETESGLTVTAELPGMEEKDIDVSISDNVLTIRGEKREQKEDKDTKDTKDTKGNYYTSECTYGSFERSIPLPSDGDTEKAEAVFTNGVLTLTVPKLPEGKSDRKKIAIKKG